ncbi:DUF383-domain-containing protein [Rickenella mellea]|uniref:Protein HGH1 homolog n=1 Tax=Rickenella mellea TaxID=50990 RepID=A0A4Y7QAB9_9AGAM|nr:DUF383-domain-containing protein [Rickenella mellea]
MDNQARELLQFLHDKNPQVRQQALSHLVGFTPKDAPHRHIFFADSPSSGLRQSTGNEAIRDLRILCLDQLATAHDAFRALVNLTESPSIISQLSDSKFLTFLVSYIVNPPSILADLACMVLSNLTKQPSVCNALLNLKVPIMPHPSAAATFYPPLSRSGTSPTPAPYPTTNVQESSVLPLLIHAFAEGGKSDPLQNTGTSPRKGDLHFLSSVIANITATPNGRMYFITPQSRHILVPSAEQDVEYPLSRLVTFTEYPDTIRRGGVAATIKNCAFYTPSHRALLSSEEHRVSIPPSTIPAPGVNLLPDILLPLAGPEELDPEEQDQLPPALQFLPDTKRREPDPALRLTHVETLLLLCATRWGRDCLRSNGVYLVVKTMHLTERDDKVAETIERLVNFLKRDEGPDDGEGPAGRSDKAEKSHDAVEGIAPTSKEDNMIEEV